MAKTKEEWKDVPGYEGVYKASTLGKIVVYVRTWNSGRWVKRSNQETEIAQFKDYKGYSVVSMRKDGLQKQKKVHRIVATTFIPNPDNKPQINHKNGVKDDNRVENLEWATQTENMVHAHKTGLLISPKGVNHGSSRLTESQVIEIKESLLGQTELSKKYNISTGAIWKIKSGKGWKHLFPLPTIHQI